MRVPIVHLYARPPPRAATLAAPALQRLLWQQRRLWTRGEAVGVAQATPQAAALRGAGLS